MLYEIGFNYLILWGHYRLTINLHQRLHGHLTDSWTIGAHLNSLGLCYYALGQFTTAIDHYQQALTITRDIGDRQGEPPRRWDWLRRFGIARDTLNRQNEATHLGNLGLCYVDLGQFTTAIEHFQQALTIARDIGYQQGEAIHLGNLGNCYANLGLFTTAINHYQQALTITRDIGYQQGEATHLSNLGSSYANLGLFTTAINHYQQALTITRDIGYQQGKSHCLAGLGECFADQGAWQTSVEQCREAIEVADEIGYAQMQCEARIFLAEVHLLAGDLNACRTAAKDAAAHDYPRQRAQTHLLIGIAQLRQDAHSEARQSFTTAVEHADEQLQHTLENYYAFDRKALALCGLAFTGQPDRVPDAIDVFRAARAITTAPGIVARTLRLLDAIAASDTDGLLTSARTAAEGDRPISD